jgi:hypothetical protein
VVATATITTDTEQSSEALRRNLLAESDSLLDEVESLRLEDATEAPPRLREAIRALQIRLGRHHPPLPPLAIDAAHELVFAVQQRLMAANPTNPRPHRHAGRPSGQPVLTLVREDRRWKLLALPSPSSFADETEWISQVDSTVERACDRWCYAQQHAVRAAREHMRAELAVAVARIAWSNYWDLLQEAERIKRGLRPPAGIPAALRR